MARPTTISDEQILEAARAVFLEEGVTASTATIARRAGVSEGTLFKRFATKEALFLKALGLPQLPHWVTELANTAGQGEVADALARITQQLIEYFRQVVPQVMLQWSSRVHPTEIMKLEVPPPVKMLSALTAFFAREMELGRVRAGDAEVCARLVMGTAFEYVSYEVMGIGAKEPLTPTAFSRRLARTLWEGMAPPPTGKRRNR